MSDDVTPDAPPKDPKTESTKLDFDEVDPTLEIPTIAVPEGVAAGPVESVLDDISTEFGGRRTPGDLVHQLSVGLQRSMFIERQTALVFAFAFVLSLGGFALFEQTVACTR